jgi:YidC/Oxa1 family membrane protein insertase
MWDALVELVRATIFAGAQIFGGSLGASVILVSALARLTLLPLLLRAARFARQQQGKLQAIQPEIERLRRKYAKDPRRLVTEMQALQQRHGIRLMSPISLLSAAIQLPLLGALFSAVRDGLGVRTRFLWITDLSRVDLILVLLVTSLAGFAATTTPMAGSPVSAKMLTAMVVGGTLMFLWSASSAVALSVGAGSAVSLLQNWLVAREIRRERATA